MLNSPKLILSAAIAMGAILGACATQDTNPYYKQSSKYPEQVPSQQTSGQQNATIRYAATPTSATNYVTEAGYPAPAGTIFADSATSASGYNQSGQPITYAAPQNYGQTYSAGQTYNYVQPAPYVAPSQIVPAITPSQNIQSVMVETGGQNAGTGGQFMQPNVTYGAQTYAAAPYAQPVIQAAVAPMPHSSVITAPRAAFGTNYIVQENDTVYSLSRRTCSSVTQIQQLNGLDNNFLIKAGGTLRLPASNC